LGLGQWLEALNLLVAMVVAALGLACCKAVATLIALLVIAG